MSDREQIHGTAVALALDSDGPLVGVLILGDSGAGKSSLAMALIDSCPFRRAALVADDAVILRRVAGGANASAPERIRGLIEVRGFGPAPVRSIPSCDVLFAIDLSARHERAPEPGNLEMSTGASVAPLYPFKWEGDEATAAARLRLMTASIFDGQKKKRTQDSAPK